MSNFMPIGCYFFVVEKTANWMLFTIQFIIYFICIILDYKNSKFMLCRLHLKTQINNSK